MCLSRFDSTELEFIVTPEECSNIMLLHNIQWKLMHEIFLSNIKVLFFHLTLALKAIFPKLEFLFKPFS